MLQAHSQVAAYGAIPMFEAHRWKNDPSITSNSMKTGSEHTGDSDLWHSSQAIHRKGTIDAVPTNEAS